MQRPLPEAPSSHTPWPLHGVPLGPGHGLSHDGPKNPESQVHLTKSEHVPTSQFGIPGYPFCAPHDILQLAGQMLGAPGLRSHIDSKVERREQTGSRLAERRQAAWPLAENDDGNAQRRGAPADVVNGPCWAGAVAQARLRALLRARAVATRTLCSPAVGVARRHTVAA